MDILYLVNPSAVNSVTLTLLSGATTSIPASTEIELQTLPTDYILEGTELVNLLGAGTLELRDSTQTYTAQDAVFTVRNSNWVTDTTYSLQWSDPESKTTVIVDEKEVDETSTSLKLFGKGTSTYGEGFQENFIQLLEHFASSTAPVNPTVGQLWFNTTKNTIFVYDNNNQWVQASGSYSSDTAPISPEPGQFWYDVPNSLLKYWTGTEWMPLLDADGPLELLADMNMNNHTVTGLNDPVNDQDAVNKRWAESTYVNAAGDTVTGNLDINGILTTNDTLLANDDITISTVGKGINFSTGHSDPAKIYKHEPADDQTELRISLSDNDNSTTDILSIGSSPGGVYTEAVKIDTSGNIFTDGTVTASIITLSSDINLSSISKINFYDSDTGTYRSLKWDTASNTFQVETATDGVFKSILTDNNTTISSQFIFAGAATFNSTTYFSGVSPTLKFVDTSGTDDFWIRVNADNFYIFTDRNNDGTWETPHPFQLDNNAAVGYIYGSDVLTRDRLYSLTFPSTVSATTSSGTLLTSRTRTNVGTPSGGKIIELESLVSGSVRVVIGKRSVVSNGGVWLSFYIDGVLQWSTSNTENTNWLDYDMGVRNISVGTKLQVYGSTEYTGYGDFRIMIYHNPLGWPATYPGSNYFTVNL